MKVLVIQGAGMNMRGKIQRDVFGTMTLPEYDAAIRAFAAVLSVDIEIFHSNLEGEVINRIYDAHERGFDGALINPAGFMNGYPALAAAIAQVGFPTIEVHVSNPARRGLSSEIARVCRATVAGCGTHGYDLALRGLLALVGGKSPS